jgi:hypothetical protein
MEKSVFINRRRTKKSLPVIKCENNDLSVPDIVKITTITEYDVDRVHKNSIKYFKKQRTTIEELKKEKNLLEDKLQKPQTLVDRNEIKYQIKKYDEKINSITAEHDYQCYIKKVLPIMEKLKKEIKNRKTNAFTNDDKPTEKILQYMLFIVNCAREYTRISFDLKLPVNNSCINCSCDLTNTLPHCNGTIRCPKCLVDNDSSRFPNNNYNFEEKAIAKQGDYSERGNFESFCDGFEGNTGTKTDIGTIMILDEYFKKNRMDIGSEVKERDLNEKGFREGTDLQMMLEALSYCGIKQYSQVYVICRDYWGWVLPDLRNVRSRIMYIYEITLVAFFKIPNKTRSSTLSIPFVFFKIIEMLGYKYDFWDFKIPEDEDSTEEREIYWKIMCETCGDSSVVYIPTKVY